MNSTATFAGGCFWCTEAVFQRLEGVKKVVPGYTGGSIKDPSYKEVAKGNTGYAEAIQITFDSKEISYEDLLHVFFATHDPTTLNRQGADIGTQYRSEIFYHDEAQKEKAEKYINEIQKDYKDNIVTKVSKFEKFYEAEDYHKNYYNNNKNSMYCKLVIDPKINKLSKIKKELALD